MEAVANYNHTSQHTASEINFQKVISDDDYQVFQLVNYLIITGSISTLGVVANVVNIIVFYKQGFNNTMNISFLGLSISDLCSLVTMLWCLVFLSPLFDDLDVKVAPSEMIHLISGLPHICFSRITSWITVFITVERCLCITLPLKIKQLITPRRTTVIICIIYILIILSFQPEYATSYLGWKFDVKANKTLIGLLFRSSRKDVEGVTFILFGILGFLSFVAVITFTLLLVIQLNKKTKWRKNANLEKLQSEIISNRDRRTVSMVVVIATVLIVCYTPGVVVSMATFCEPEFSVIGRYANVYFTGWSFVVTFESFNSSINILLYYHMSSKYRETFYLTFPCWKVT